MVKASAWGRRAICGGLLVVSGWLTGCASPSTSSPTVAESDNGTLAISLTDKPGDFANYAVQISDLTLTHANGAVVHTIAQPVTVDFAQYVQMSEFLTLLPVRHGHYVKATMTLDFAAANIMVEGNDGKPVQIKADAILGADGKKIDKPLVVDVQLEGPTALTIAPGLLHHLHLDFDLAATNKVVFDANGVPSLTVEPALIAEVSPKKFKEHRMRGLLDTVDVAQHSFVLEMRPFMAALVAGKTPTHDRDDHKLFGDITVQTTDKTTFTINGKDVVNAEGLNELNKMARPARVVVKGTPKFNPFRIEASDVDAQTMDQGPDHAVLEGTVLKRAANEITVRGAVEDKDGKVAFGQDVVVNLANANDVTTWHPTPNVGATIADISVGQRLHVAGALSADHKLNAVKIHLQATLVAGTVKAVGTNAPYIATLDLANINGIAVAAFDFTGAGKADVVVKGDAYTVNLGNLSLPVGGLTRVVGKPVPFGTADTYAYVAVTAIDLKDVPVVEEIRWATPSNTSITVAVDHASLTTTVGTADKFSLMQAGIKLGVASAPTIKGAAGDGVYVIQQPAHNNAVFRQFADFAAELSTRLGAGSDVKALRAMGDYADGTLTATWVSVSLSKK